jgi:hypothetical protein
MRYDVASVRVDQGYPTKIRGGNWTGVFEDDIDAA